MSAASSWATDVHLKSVLVATDFSEASEKALHHALAIARHYHAKIYLAHVVSSLGFTLAGPEATTEAAALAVRDMSALEHKLVTTGALWQVGHQIVVRQGEIWNELQTVMRERSIDMVVVGTHGRGGLKKLVLGSVAEQIFRQACCRVLTVGPGSPAEAQLEATGALRPLLFATDFTEASLQALPHAISFANDRRTRLVVLHVLSPVPHVESNRWYTAGDVVHLQAEEQARVRRHLEKLVEQAPLVLEPEFVVESGEPAEGILRVAETHHAEAIVMGLRRRTHVDSLAHLPWSNAYQVVCNAVCPVLTIRS